MSLPKRRVLSPLIPGSRTPEEFRRAVEEVTEQRGKGGPSHSIPSKQGFDVGRKKRATGDRSTATDLRPH